MVMIIRSLVTTLVSLFWSRAKPHHEILILRHQLNVLRRTSPKRVSLTSVDRLLFVWSYRICVPKIHPAAEIGKSLGSRGSILKHPRWRKIFPVRPRDSL